MKNFSLSLNGALIKSNVNFEPGSKEEDRPMQGQSPYLVNAGLFYQQPKTDGMPPYSTTASVNALSV